MDLKKIPRGFYLYVRINPLWNTETKEDHTINCFTLNIFLVVTCKREYWCSAKYSVESPSPSPSISSILETIHLQYYTLQLHIIHKHRIRSKLHPNINWLYTIAMYSQQFLYYSLCRRKCIIFYLSYICFKSNSLQNIYKFGS